MHLIVLAKEPVPGRVKTRLCPPCTPEAAAALAEAALTDTLDAVSGVSGVEPVIVLEGESGRWLPPGMRVVAQRGAGLGDRIAAAFDDVGGPALLIGMDTPQVTADVLSSACALLSSTTVEAVLGPAVDGGWWAIGLLKPDARVFAGVPMSTPSTGDAQRERMRELSLRFEELPPLRDVDLVEDALAVADEAPGSRFARSVREHGIGANVAGPAR